MSTSFSTTRELSLRNILDELRGVGFSSANWRPLGMRLKPDFDLDAIEADFPRVDRRLEEVIKGWQRDGDNPSWETLAEAVSQCKDGNGGGKNVARNIRQSVGLDTITEQLSDEQCSPANSPAQADSASEQRQQFRKRRSESFTELQELFAYLMSDLVEILGDEQVLPKMKTTLDYLPWQENPKFKNVLSESYKTASSVKEFFDALRPTCLDCELLAITVEATKCLEAIAALDRYLKVKDSTTIPTSGDDEKDKVESTVQTSPNGCASNFKIVEACIQKESVNGRQYEEATGWLSYMWKIPRAALRFFRGKKGSVILEWQIEASLESHISSVPVTGLALKKFAAMGVTQIKVGDSYELEIPTELPPEAEESAFSSAALSSAMWARDDDMMERLIKGGASPDTQDEGGFSLLMGACKIGRPYIVDALLRNGATVDLRDKGGWSALHTACSHQHTEVVRLLLSKGANPNSSQQDGWSVMMAACRKESPGAEVLNELLKAGGDPNAGNHESWTALMTAARNGRLNCVVKLLEYKADPDMQDNTGWSALMASVWNNHEDMAIRMLEAGATSDIQNNNGTNALLLAIYRQLPRVIKAVLSYQPKHNVNLQDKVGETALMYACKMKDLESVKTLLDMDANPNTVSDGKETALLLATQRKEVKITEVLLGAGADPDYRTENRISALMLSSKEGSIEITDLLLKHSAQPDLIDEKSGYTALMFGAEAGHLVVVKNLIRAEAQTALKNKDNTDAYYLAYQNKHVDVAKTIHQAHFSRHSTPPTNPSTLNKPKPSSEEVLEFLKILLGRLQRPPLLMEEFTDAESKRRKFASTQQQTINIAPTEVAVGAA